MSTKTYVATICCVQRSCAQVEIEAETLGDARVIAERMAREGRVPLRAADETIDVESVERCSVHGVGSAGASPHQGRRAA